MATLIVIGNKRKDGKYKVKYTYDGGPNAFGGFYPGRSYTKIKTVEQIKEDIARDIYTFTVPVEILRSI